MTTSNFLFLESDAEFEGVGAHRDNPRFDLATALADAEAANFRPFDGTEPDVDHVTGDERETEPDATP
jgi:hypothetical protein